MINNKVFDFEKYDYIDHGIYDGKLIAAAEEYLLVGDGRHLLSRISDYFHKDSLGRREMKGLVYHMCKKEDWWKLYENQSNILTETRDRIVIEESRFGYEVIKDLYSSKYIHSNFLRIIEVLLAHKKEKYKRAVGKWIKEEELMLFNLSFRNNIACKMAKYFYPLYSLTENEVDYWIEWLDFPFELAETRIDEQLIEEARYNAGQRYHVSKARCGTFIVYDEHNFVVVRSYDDGLLLLLPIETKRIQIEKLEREGLEIVDWAIQIKDPRKIVDALRGYFTLV